MKLVDDRILNVFTTLAIDRVRNIRIEFLWGVMSATGTAAELTPAMIAMGRSQMVLVVTFVTMSRQFATGHGDKWTVGTIDDFQVAYDE